MNIKAAIVFLLCAIPSLAEWVMIEQILAKVNDDIITRAEYDDVLEKSKAQSPNTAGSNAAEEQDTLRKLIDERLLVQKAKSLNLNVEPQVLRQRDEIMRQYQLKTIQEFETFATDRLGMPVEDVMEQIRRGILTQTVIGQEVGSKVTIPQADVQKYYEEHQQDFVRSEGVHLREILISNERTPREKLPEVEKEAKEVLERVRSGEVFAEMARRFSDNPASAPNGGDIGIFRRGQLKAEIENEVLSHDRGYVTDLIVVPNGYLILKVEERYREGLAALEEVRDEIRSKLSEPLWGPALRAYLDDLRRDAFIEIRPGYVDTGAVAEMDTSWNDPARLLPATTTKQEALQQKRRRRFLGIPLPGLPGKSIRSSETPAENSQATGNP